MPSSRSIARPDLAEDARFDTNPNRLTNRQALTDIIESWMATFETDAEVMSALEGARVPYGPSLSPTDALTHPHFVERGLVRTVSDPLAGNVQIPGFPFKSTVPLPPDDHVAPALGEHNRDVLIGMAGLSEARRLVAPEPMACGCVADSPVRTGNIASTTRGSRGADPL